MLAGGEDHVELLGCLAPQTLFEFVGDGIGIDEHHSHLASHIGGSDTVVAMGVVECVAFEDIIALLGVEVAQFLVIVVLLYL